MVPPETSGCAYMPDSSSCKSAPVSYAAVALARHAILLVHVVSHVSFVTVMGVSA